jgi:hypothetical protein
MSDPPREDRQEIHVHIEDRGGRSDVPPEDQMINEEAAAASAMSAQLIWIILVVVLVVAVVLLFTTGVIDLGGAEDALDDVISTPTS